MKLSGTWSSNGVHITASDWMVAAMVDVFMFFLIRLYGTE
jgi:hypothetical protein